MSALCVPLPVLGLPAKLPFRVRMRGMSPGKQWQHALVGGPGGLPLCCYWCTGDGPLGGSPGPPVVVACVPFLSTYNHAHSFCPPSPPM